MSLQEHSQLRSRYSTTRTRGPVVNGAEDAAVGDGFVVGLSRQMRDLYSTVERVASTRANILLTGESGTGKEIVALRVHSLSSCKDGPFVPINCGAVPEGLFESELFGHVKGAFTGAVEKRRGLFEEAHGGTLFLDEIGELSPAMQVKLLRVLQDQKIRPVGGNSIKHLNVRIIAATNKDLKLEVAKNQFRDDLFYRLNIISLHLPALRERMEDVPELAKYFLAKYNRAHGMRAIGFTSDAYRKLSVHSWPGNVRELENVIERAVVLTQEGVIGPDNLILEDQMTCSQSEDKPTDCLPTLRQVEKEYVAFVLSKTLGRKEEAARILGIDRKTLHRKRQAKLTSTEWRNLDFAKILGGR